MYFIITDFSSGNSLNPAYCKAVRDQAGLTMPVLLDAAEVMPDHIGVTTVNDWNVVLKAGGEIVFKKKYAPDGAIDVVEELLAAPDGP